MQYIFANRKWLKWLLIAFTVLFVYFAFLRDVPSLSTSSFSSDDLSDLYKKSARGVQQRGANYKGDCLKLFKKLRYPNQSLIMKPPAQRPPADMLNDFQQNGDMPITKYSYYDDTYSDAGPEKEGGNGSVRVIGNAVFDLLGFMIRNDYPMGYKDTVLKDKIFRFQSHIKHKSVAVLGSWDPWVEALAYTARAGKITTLEYTRSRQFEDPKLEWVHVYDFFDRALETKSIENFDAVISFSTIEHAGLGRYGDALDPYGDWNAVKQVHCMLKPGGLFLLGLPSSHSGASYIEFNAHRVYGRKRLQLLFQGWKLIESTRSNNGADVIYVLIKE